MKTLRRLILLYLAFTVEIQIALASQNKFAKALAAEDHWLSEPAHCHPADAHCSLLVKSKKITFKWNGRPIMARQGTALWWRDQSTLRLIEGAFSARLDGTQKVDFAGGVISGDGLFMIQRRGSKSLVTALDGQIAVRPLGASQDLILPAGYSLTMGGMTAEGTAQVEIPQAANPVSTLKNWWLVFDGPKSEFMPVARRFMEGASGRAALASDWHRQMVQRALASQREAEELRRERLKIEEGERAKMRALFRKMNYLTD